MTTTYICRLEASPKSLQTDFPNTKHSLVKTWSVCAKICSFSQISPNCSKLNQNSENLIKNAIANELACAASRNAMTLIRAPPHLNLQLIQRLPCGPGPGSGRSLGCKFSWRPGANLGMLQGSVCKAVTKLFQIRTRLIQSVPKRYCDL